MPEWTQVMRARQPAMAAVEFRERLSPAAVAYASIRSTWPVLLVLLAAMAVAVAVAAVASWPGMLGSTAPTHHGQLLRQTKLAQVPLAAEGPVSRALGRDDLRYRAVPAHGGFALANPGQGFQARLGGHGLEVVSGRAVLGLSLLGYGYGQTLRPVGTAAPRAAANRVVYRRGPLSEWYVNGPLGLEQGFTLAAPPAGRRVGQLTVALGMSGNLHTSLSGGADAVTFAGAGGSLTYRGLVATDARGRTLSARIELGRGRLILRVDDRGAQYPLRIDPFVQRAKLTASDGASGDLLGDSVAVSGDTVVVGARDATVGSNTFQGAAYVFTKPAGGWASATETAKLTASDGAFADEFGSSVAVSGDTVVVGAPVSKVGSNSGQGAAYVFTKPAGGWANATEKAKLTASDGASSDRLGSSVAVSGDTVVAGAPFAQVGSNGGQGAAYLFTMPTAGWAGATTQTAKLTASDGASNEGLGNSVAVSGGTVVAGAPFATVGSNTVQGAAYVFTMPTAGWAGATTQTAKLTASDGASNEGLGYSVAVSGDTVVAGAPFATVGSNISQGAAYVFTMPAAGWAGATTETAKLTASDGASSDRLGFSTTVSGDTVVAGAPFANTQGAAYVFTMPAAGWASATETAKLTAAGGASHDELGYSVAVSGDTVVVGALGAKVGSNSAQGAAYVFEPQSPDNDLGIGTVQGISTPATSAAGASVTFTPPAATDEGGETPSVGCDHSSGDTFAVGTTKVTCTATDSDDSPSSAQSSFNVTVTDADLTLHGVPADVSTAATSPSGASVTYTPPTATDEGGQTPAVHCDHGSGSTFAVGTTKVTCSATASDGDDASSPASASFNVTVTDSDLALHGVPANITTNATGPTGATVTYTTPTATDEGGQTPAVSCDHASGSTFAIGTTTVTCKATASDGDDASSPAKASFTVTVKGVLAQLQDLLTYVQSLPPGHSLSAKVQTAIHSYQAGGIRDTCSTLTALINEATAQSGKHITAAQANTVITAAKRIRAAIGC